MFTCWASPKNHKLCRFAKWFKTTCFASASAGLFFIITDGHVTITLGKFSISKKTNRVETWRPKMRTILVSLVMLNRTPFWINMLIPLLQKPGLINGWHWIANFGSIAPQQIFGGTVFTHVNSYKSNNYPRNTHQLLVLSNPSSTMIFQESEIIHKLLVKNVLFV